MNPLNKADLTAYYDARTPVVAEAAAWLETLDRALVTASLEEVAQDVRSRTEGLADDRLGMVVVSVTDDLYKIISNADSWSEEADLYVAAVFGTVFAVAAERALRVQYVVENVYADLTRPLHVFPYVFQAAGMVYACPQHLAAHLAERDGAVIDEDPEVNQLSPWAAEGQFLAGELVRRASEEGRHFMYLEADLNEGGLDAVLALADAPGVVGVFRNEAPLPGSNVRVSFGRDTLP